MLLKVVGRVLIVVFLALHLLPVLGAAAVQDVIGTPYEGAVMYLKDLGVIEGRPEGFFPLEPITRAEATKIIVGIIGHTDLAHLLRGATSFPDVPSAHWASGYIAVAKNMGILHGFPDGTFKPEAMVTYAQYAKMLVEAAGLSPVTGVGWPTNYVVPAAGAGMLDEVAFSADQSAIRGDCAIMTAHTVQKVPNPATGKTLAQSVFGAVSIAWLEIVPSSTTLAIGSPVTFSVIARDGEGVIVPDVIPTFTTSDPLTSSVTADGRFAATHAGSYTVTARVGTYSAVATVGVYGAPVALKLTASATGLAANGVSTATLTAEVVDVNGTRVLNATNAITLSHQISNGAVTLPSATQINATNGTAQFTVTAGTLFGVTDTLQVAATGLTVATVSISAVEPVARSLRLTAEPTMLTANEVTHGTVTAEVLDQTGQLMTFGTYYISFSTSGKGRLEGGTETIVVGTVAQKAVVDVSSVAGDPGTFRITASATGLGSQSVTITTYIAGAPKALRVTSTDVSGVAGAVDDMRITVTLVDSNNRPSPALSVIEVEFVTPAGSGFTGLGDLVFGIGESYKIVEFGASIAGRHTVTVRDKDTADPEVTSATFTCTVTATNIEQISVSPSGDPVIYLPVGSPQITLTAQLQDGAGNDVAKSGVKLEFSAVINGLGSVTWSAPNGRTTTDSAGRATITMYGQSYVGNAYTVTVDADVDNDGQYDDASGSSESYGFLVTDQVPKNLSIVFENEVGAAMAFVRADASQEAYCRITVKDAYGNVIERSGLDVEVVFSNAGRNVLLTTVNAYAGTGYGPATDEDHVFRFLTNGDGEAIFSLQGGLAGTFTVTAKALNVLPAATTNGSFRTTAGSAAANAMVLKTDNTPAMDITYRANRAVQLRVGLVDNGGNPIPAPGVTTLELAPSGTGEYRLSSTGTAVTSVELARGVAYRTIYYISAANGTADLWDDVTDYTAYAFELTIDGSDIVATLRASDDTAVPGATVTLSWIAGTGSFVGGASVTGTTNAQGMFRAAFTGTGTVAGAAVDAHNKAGGALEEIADTVSTP